MYILHIIILLYWRHSFIDQKMCNLYLVKVYKNLFPQIRHVKAGVRLTHLLLQCSCEVTKQLLENNIMDKLYDLYHKPHMALSIKLLILK